MENGKITIEYGNEQLEKILLELLKQEYIKEMRK